MKTLIVSLAALAAVSGTALASDRGVLESDVNFGKFATHGTAKLYANGNSSASALAVNGNAASLTAYERMLKISKENEHGGK